MREEWTGIINAQVKSVEGWRCNKYKTNNAQQVYTDRRLFYPGNCQDVRHVQGPATFYVQDRLGLMASVFSL